MVIQVSPTFTSHGSGACAHPALRPLRLVFFYVAEVDSRFRRALDAGCTEVMALAEQSYGRSGGVKDPFGHVWWLSTHKAQAE